MKMIDVTNSHYDLVTKQLECSDASIVKVYTLGPTTVFYSAAPTHKNIIVINKSRPVRAKEIDFAICQALSKTTRQCQCLFNFVELELRP